MKLVLKNKTSHKTKNRLKKKVRIRKKVYGSEVCPRLTVYKSLKHIYAQIVDDTTGKTLVEASTRSAEVSKSTGSKEAAKLIGIEIAKRAQKKNIINVVFDRNGFLYHGRIQALADGAREAGLKF